MWSKTTVLYVALVTLAVIGSIASVPLKEINVPTAAAPEVIIVKPKRNVVGHLNTTTIPPVPFLLNIMLDALGRGPQSEPDMMTSMYDTMSQMEQHVPKTSPPAAEPIRKSMSKTEVINGHLVETNETVYSDGDDNFKSFYHFKKVVVVPEGNGNKKDSVESAEKSNAETMVKNKMNKNPSRQNDNNKSNLSQNNGEPIPLDDHFQMAAATYYAPSIPYGLSNPSPIFGLTDYNNRLHTLPPYYQAGGHVHYPSGYQISSANNNLGLPGHRPAPISLHNDIHVNELIAAQLQGTNAALPPDVELFKGKPPALRKGHHNHNDHHNRGQEKFPGRKN